MTTIPIFQLDAFTDKPFGGNPAAVCPLQEWLPDEVMQSIALENNVSETAFYVPEGDGFLLRWFTPKIEVALPPHQDSVLLAPGGRHADQLPAGHGLPALGPVAGWPSAGTGRRRTGH